jgi:DNA-binding NarL/FixJ family response regulator
MAKKQQVGPKRPERMPLPIRLVIIDNELKDWIAILEGLRQEPNVIELLASFKSMSLALPLLEEGRVDVALVGAGLPWTERTPSPQFFKQRWPRLAVVLIGEKSSKMVHRKVVVTPGCPCLLHPFQTEELMAMLHHAIREACLRKTPTPGVTPQSGAFTRDLWIQEKRLKPREVEALNFVREGLLDKEIAGKMGCSEADTKWILRCVYAKLGVHHRAEAINIWNAVPR